MNQKNALPILSILGLLAYLLPSVGTSQSYNRGGYFNNDGIDLRTINNSVNRPDPSTIMREFQESMDNMRRTEAMLALQRWQNANSNPERDQQVEATYELLGEGIATLTAGHPQPAIDLYFDPLIEVFEATLDAQEIPAYVARTNKEAMYYILMAAADDEHVQAISSYGAEVYYWKSMAQNTLGNTTGAETSLDRAIELSPAHSWFLATRADWNQSDLEWQDALEGYELAARMAREFSPERERLSELSNALHGRASVLFELGRLEEAAIQYEECLSLNEDDQEASIQLAYIRHVLVRRDPGIE